MQRLSRVMSREQSGASGERGLVSRYTSFTEIERRRATWLWPLYVPARVVTLLEGDPEQGKSLFTLDLCARVSTGSAMPDGTGGGEPADCLIFSCEDDRHDVIGNRLDEAGANVARVGVLDFFRDGDPTPTVFTDEFVSRVEHEAITRGVRLIVVDPLVVHLPPADTDKDASVRRALLPLVGLAGRTGAAVVALRHWTKQERPAIHRGQGSTGFAAAARMMLCIGPAPDDETGRSKVLAAAKSSYGQKPPPRAFRIEARPESEHPRLVWEGVSPHTADDLAGTRISPEDRGALSEAREFLNEFLAAGERPVTEVLKAAGELGVTGSTLRRAGKVEGLKKRKDGLSGPWLWRLPSPEDVRGATASANGHLRKHLATFDTEAGFQDTRKRGDTWEGQELRP